MPHILLLIILNQALQRRPIDTLHRKPGIILGRTFASIFSKIQAYKRWKNQEMVTREMAPYSNVCCKKPTIFGFWRFLKKQRSIPSFQFKTPPFLDNVCCWQIDPFFFHFYILFHYYIKKVSIVHLLFATMPLRKLFKNTS